MTATTVPWPQLALEQTTRDLVEFSNLAYAILLPWIVIESLFSIHRSSTGWRSGEAVMLIHLLCAVVIAVLFFGDPRIRSSYDVFGLALLAALIVDRVHLSAGLSLQNDPHDPPPSN